MQGKPFVLHYQGQCQGHTFHGQGLWA